MGQIKGIIMVLFVETTASIMYTMYRTKELEATYE